MSGFFGFLHPSLEEREWNTTQSKKLWWLMPIALGSVFFLLPVFSFVHDFIWGVLISNILMKMWVHKAFVTQNFNYVILYKMTESFTFGLIIGYAVKILTFSLVGGVE